MAKHPMLLFLSVFVLALTATGCTTKPDESEELRPPVQGTIEGAVVTQLGDGTCPLPPPDFSEANLVGTWVAGFGQETDSITIRGDGTYSQRTKIKALNYSEESASQKWWIEFGESGIPYLHLSGMQLCVSYHLANCERRGGGEQGWWDPCEKRVVRMPDEGILVVMGIPDGFVQTPRGIQLVPLTRDPDSSGLVYILQK